MHERLMTRCFMNGKSCIYERTIDERLRSRDSASEKKAFVMMPFGEQLDALYQWEIAPFLRHGGRDGEYKCTPERADDVRQVGFIICEKICKKIQEADYIVVDVSIDNPNVFYEFGLATALSKKIIPICVSEKQAVREGQFYKLFGIDHLMPYPRFGWLDANLGDFLWKIKSVYYDFGQMAGDKVAVLYDSNHVLYSQGRYSEESYDFGAICKTAVGSALAEVFSSENIRRNPELGLYDKVRIEKILSPSSVDLSQSSYKEVIESCKDAACVLIDVSLENSIMNFFWLGYIHGIGGNAIPVNCYKKDSDQKGGAVPFDIRALWHVVVREDQPIELSHSLKEILEYIYTRKAKYLNREAFWKEILKSNKVSVFLGSLYLEDLGRNTIGDWDYRTAAEITNYLSTSKETIKVTLESPLPKRERMPEDTDEPYLEWLRSKLKENSIIVASADVNDLTEFALCKILGQIPFKKISDNDTKFRGYIAHKKYSKSAIREFPEMAFYLREKADYDSRGFIIRDGMGKYECMEPHVYPGQNLDCCVRKLLGQLVLARNPFDNEKWIVIISGISGPATLGIAQMLTGCMYKEFTINNLSTKERKKGEIEILVEEYKFMMKKTDKNTSTDLEIAYDALSENMLSRLLEIAEESKGQVNALVEVDVYYPPRDETSYSNDERKIIGWRFPDLVGKVRRQWANPNNLHCGR